jgi:branched-chain amino acid transport system substrate-binding protein
MRRDVKENAMRGFLIAVLIAVCLLFQNASAVRAADAQPYTMNVILSLTGGGAFIGQTHQKVLGILENQVNKQGGIRGRPLHLVFADDNSNPQTAVALATQILQSKPVAVFGPNSAGLCSAIAPLFQAAKVFNWCFSPTFYPPVGGFVYPSMSGSKDLMRIQVRFMRQRGIKKLAMLSTTDVSGKTGESELVEILKEPESRGVTLVADEVFGPTDVGVGAQLARIKASSPDAVMIWTAGPALGTALTGVRDTGLDALPIFASSSAMVYSQIIGLANSLPKTIYFVGFGFDADSGRNAVSTRKLKAFDEAVIAAGMDIDGVTGFAWDGVAIVVDALRALGPDATAEHVRAWVAGQKAYPGISGLYNFTSTTDMHGLGLEDLLMVRWDAAKQTWIPVSKFGGAPLEKV